MTMYLTVLMKIYQKVSSYLLQRSRITLSYRNPHAKKRMVSSSVVVERIHIAAKVFTKMCPHIYLLLFRAHFRITLKWCAIEIVFRLTR